MPPQSDPQSWSNGLAMLQVNAVARMDSCDIKNNCAVDTDSHGVVNSPEVDAQLCDLTIAKDALIKLRIAAQNQIKSKQPFFLNVGFRKPHLDFRFPKHMLNLFPDLKDVDVAMFPTLDPSQPSLAHHDNDPQDSPFVAVDNTTAQYWRQYYRASVAWMDIQVYYPPFLSLFLFL